MKANDMKAIEVAEGSGVPASALSRFFSGQTSLSAKNMNRIVHFTNGEVTLDDLIQEGEATKAARESAGADAVKP